MVDCQNVKDYLVKQIAEFMYMEVDEIENDELFSNFGLESTTLTKIVTNVCNKFEISFEVKDILEHQTVDKAASFICNMLNGD